MAKKAKRKYKKKALPNASGLFATAERRGKFGNIKTEAVYGPNGIALFKRDRAMITCQLDVYKYREQIPDPLYEAAWKYRCAFLFHVLGIKIDDMANSGRTDEISKRNAKIHSERVLAEAHEVLSDAQAAVVRAICGMDECAGNTYRYETFLRGCERMAKRWKMGPT
jgi:hypothetical protein